MPIGVTKIDWQFAASARVKVAGDGDGATVRDALKVSQTVIAATPERTYQATIMQLAAAQAFTVQRPVDAIPGRGGVDVRVQAKLGGDLPGVREFFRYYPYTCLEQRVSVAVGLESRALWDATMSNIDNLMDRDGLLKYWAFLRDGDDSLTAYVLSIGDEAGWEIPAPARARIEAALVGFVEGRIVRYSALQTADLAIRKMTALEALSRGKTAFNPKWLDSISIEPNLWPTSAVIDWYLVLKRQPKLARRDERMREAEQILRSRLNFQGTTMGFSTEKSDALWWLMISADSNANKLAHRAVRRAGVARRRTAHGHRQPVPHAARALEHDGGQRLGRPCDEEILDRIRKDSRDRRHRGDAGRRVVRARLEARRRHETVPPAAAVAAAGRAAQDRARRRRQAMGGAVEHRRDPAHRAAVFGIQSDQDGHSG